MLVVSGRLLAAGVCALMLAGSSAAFADEYTGALLTAARTIEDAARAHTPKVPDVHVPPAPLPGPPRYSPSLDDWLQATLRSARAAKLPKARAHMLRAAAGTLRLAVSETQANASPPTRPVGPTVAAILADPAYHQSESSAQARLQKSWWERFVEWFAGLFERLFEGLSSAASGVPLLGQILAALIIAVIVGLVLLVGYRLARYFMSARRRSRKGDDTGELIEPGERPEALYARARAAASAGRYAAAVTLVFRAGLLLLDARGVIPYDAARTAGEYRRAVRRERSQAAPPFDELARSFTLAAYAEAPVGERDWRGADDAYHSFAPRVEQARETVTGS